MIALIKDGAVDKYPITVRDMQKLHPNVSFPRNLASLGKDSLSAYNLVTVNSVEIPTYDGARGRLSEGLPIKEVQTVDGKEVTSWKQNWVFTEYDAKYLEKAAQEAKEQKIQLERQKRNGLLYESDVDLLRKIEAGSAITDELKAYRQALRDVPAQSGFPDSITWPTKP